MNKESDEAAVEELKRRLSDVSHGKFTYFDFLRWLQGHDFKTDVVAPKLRHHMRLLQSYDFDAHVPNAVIERYWPHNVLGPSGKDNTVAILMCLGRLDGYGIVKSVSSTECTKTLIHYMEKLLDRFREEENRNGEQSGLLFILDFDGMQIDDKWLWLARGPARILFVAYTLHYAEFMQKTLCVNCPPLFYYIYQIVKTVLPERTCRKVEILGSNWKNEISKYIDPSALPVGWGGRKVEIDDDVIRTPTTVDESCYWTHRDEPSRAELKTFVVHARKCDYLTFYVPNAGSTLEWYFHTNKDFGFGVYFTENESECDDENMRMVYPYVGRMLGTIAPIHDKVVCLKIGYYKLRFNNDFSWLYKLKVSYKVTCKSEMVVCNNNR